MEAKTVSDSRTVQHRIVMYPDSGGYLAGSFSHGLTKLPGPQHGGIAAGMQRP